MPFPHYLATVMDLYSRKIVGGAMADHLRAELPLAALAMAIATQRPGAGGRIQVVVATPDEGGCDEHSKAAFRSMWAGTIVVTRSTAGFRASMSPRPIAMTTLRWRASSTRSKLNSSITSIMQHVRKPDSISLLTSRAFTIERVATRHWISQPDRVGAKSS